MTATRGPLPDRTHHRQAGGRIGRRGALSSGLDSQNSIATKFEPLPSASRRGK